MDPLVGTTFAGRWLIERPLRAGGMGVVYVAKHVETGRPVAVKIIKSEAARDAAFVARFHAETTALAKVTHPNVVAFLDSGAHDDAVFLVMELLEGRPLRTIMGAPIEWRRAFKIGADVCRGLAAAHAQSIVHRDLKPENVFLLSSAGHDDFAKLLDFGIAQLEGVSTWTQTGAVVGTPGYIAPEQLQGHVATERSDVYAVGIILYELVTGRSPFKAPNVQAMLAKQLFEDVAAPRSMVSSIPPDVDATILRFLARDPAARFTSALDALAALTGEAGPSASAGANAATPTIVSLPSFVPTEAETRVTPPVVRAPKLSRRATIALRAAVVAVGVIGGTILSINQNPRRGATDDALTLSPPAPLHVDKQRLIEIERPPPAPPPVDQFGFLTIDAQPPYVRVKVNLKDVASPVEKLRLPVGNYMIHMTCGPRLQTVSINIKPGEHEKLPARFDPITCKP